jgi:hypothetical protein
VERCNDWAWQDPSPVLLWGQGHACVSLEATERQIWIPSWFVKTHGIHQLLDAEVPPDRRRGAQARRKSNRQRSCH